MSDEPMREIKKEYEHKTLMAELEKEMDAEKTRLAARNKFLIDYVADGLARAANADSNPYLAINWQRLDVPARFTSGGRRFPSPQLATSHLFRPNQRRTARLVATEFATESRFSREQLQREGPRGGSPTHASGKCLYRLPHSEIFCPMDPLHYMAVSEKNPAATSAPMPAGNLSCAHYR
jgi:hypothetical protein